MTEAYYIFPKPGNGKDHLQKTVEAFEKVGYTPKENDTEPLIRVIGHGYPPVCILKSNEGNGKPSVNLIVKVLNGEPIGEKLEEPIKKQLSKITKIIDDITSEEIRVLPDEYSLTCDENGELGERVPFDKLPHKGQPDITPLPPAPIVNTEKEADVFLSYNSVDKDAVLVVHQKLRDKGINTWIDKEQLEKGLPVLTNLETAISTANNAIVFIGKEKLGPWQKHEVNALFTRFVEGKGRVIPTLLPGVKFPEDLPILGTLLRVEFNDINDENAIKELVKAIKGGSSSSTDTATSSAQTGEPKTPTHTPQKGEPKVNPEPPKPTNLPAHVVNATNGQLVSVLSEYFELNDIKRICVQVEIPYNQLDGDNDTKRIASLIEKCRVNGTIPTLKQLAYDKKPAAFDALKP